MFLPRQANLFGWQLPDMWAAVMGGDEPSEMDCSDDETDEEEEAAAAMDCTMDEEEESEDTVQAVHGDVPASGSTAATELVPEAVAVSAGDFPAQRSFGGASFPVKSSPHSMAGASLSDLAAATFVPATPSAQGPCRAFSAEVRTCGLRAPCLPLPAPASLSPFVQPNLKGS